MKIHARWLTGMLALAGLLVAVQGNVQANSHVFQIDQAKNPKRTGPVLVSSSNACIKRVYPVWKNLKRNLAKTTRAAVRSPSRLADKASSLPKKLANRLFGAGLLLTAGGHLAVHAAEAAGLHTIATFGAQLPIAAGIMAQFAGYYTTAVAAPSFLRNLFKGRNPPERI